MGSIKKPVSAEKQRQLASSGTMNDAARKARDLEPDVRKVATARGMDLDVRWLACPGGVTTCHWMLNAGSGRRILDFWPGTGTWRCHRTGETGVLEFAWQIIELASKLAAAHGVR